MPLLAALALWVLGYADQALERSHGALPLAQELSHHFSLAGPGLCGQIHHFRREGSKPRAGTDGDCALERAGVSVLDGVGNDPTGLGAGRARKGEGLTQMRQGLSCLQATGAELVRPHILAMLAEAYGTVGQAEEGLSYDRGAGGSGQNRGVATKQSCIGLKGSSRCNGLVSKTRNPHSAIYNRRPKRVFRRPSTLRASNKRSRWNSAP